MDKDLLNKLILQLELKVSSSEVEVPDITQDLEVIRAHINSNDIQVEDMGEPWVSKENA